MTTIATTDLPPGEARRETFLGGEVEVLSRSGLHPSESAMMAEVPRHAAARRHLVAGNRTGALQMAIAALSPGCAVASHCFDVHHARAVARNFSANGHEGFGAALPLEPFGIGGAPLSLSCRARLPEGPFDVAWIQASKTNTPTEVALDLLEQAHEALVEGGWCVVGVDGEIAWMQEQMKRIFGKVSAYPPRGGGRVLAARKSGALRKRRDFSAGFPASLPDGLPPLSLSTVPGVFAHRRPDAGGLALAEVALARAKPGDSILDLGCGCGLVGLLLARHVAPGGHVTLVDSDARAFECSVANAAANGLSGLCDFALSDSGIGGAPRFDLVVGNPPYYSDYAIAGLFIREAGEVARDGGLAMIVARDARHHAELLEKFVGPATVEERRGYQVAIAVRRRG